MSESGAQEVERRVRLLRRRGDAFIAAAAESGQEDQAQDAYSAYRGALAIVEDWLTGASSASGDSAAVPGDDQAVADTANMLGIRGGLYRRLHEPSRALGSYREGAAIETTRGLPATYNRTNAIKLALIAGDRTLAQLHDELLELRRALERRLATDERATDDAWLWADLGDIHLLLGDDAEAMAAYQTFADKARSTSPASTLSLMREVEAAMVARGDPAADRIAMALGRAQQVLGRWPR